VRAACPRHAGGTATVHTRGLHPMWCPHSTTAVCCRHCQCARSTAAPHRRGMRAQRCYDVCAARSFLAHAERPSRAHGSAALHACMAGPRHSHTAHLHVRLLLGIGVVLRLLRELLRDDELGELDIALRHLLSHAAQELVHRLHNLLGVLARQHLLQAPLADLAAQQAPVSPHNVDSLALQHLHMHHAGAAQFTPCMHGVLCACRGGPQRSR
jgi:hypothetical protein